MTFLLVLGKIVAVIILAVILGRLWWILLVLWGLYYVIRISADIFWWGKDEDKW